mmetsp:Transcript_17132/g.19484  ORF Transcript_17132/g.19484 Transcript_17132/m.19484 type:complete len:138 (+) Transcript_17132:138-551(+)
MSEAFMNRALVIGGLFEFLQVARLKLGNEAITEFMPFIAETSPAFSCSQYRNSWTLFTAVLGSSRVLAWAYKERGIHLMSLAVHFLEVAFFFNEASKYPKAFDLKQKILLAVILVIPLLLVRHSSTFKVRKDSAKSN